MACEKDKSADYKTDNYTPEGDKKSGDLIIENQEIRSNLKIGKGLVLGADHSCVLSGRGEVRCWGRNGVGQLGQGHQNHLGDEAGEMGDNLPFVDVGKGLAVRSLVAGSDFTCVILNNGQVKCWGYNHVGQLGLGSSQ